MVRCPPPLLFLTLLVLHWRRTASFAAPAPIRPFVELSTIQSNSNVDLLPSTLVTAWPTWILTLSPNEDSSTSSPASWYRVPDSSSDEGFLNPVSMEELWLPLDLRPPTMQLALGLHVRNGACRHVFPAVDLMLGTAGTNTQNAQPSEHQHRNRGLCSVPRAYQWQETSSFLLDQQNYRMVLETSSGLTDEEDDDNGWIPVQEWNVSIIENLMSRALECLAGEPPSELGHGSHVVHVVWHDDSDTTATAPHCRLKADHDLRVVLRNDAMMEMHELRVRVASTAV